MNFEKLKAWIDANFSPEQQAADWVVSVEHGMENIPTIHVTIETPNILADLVVWENGNTSMVVGSSHTGEFLCDKHDLVLTNDDYDAFFGEFLAQLK